jgi:hypothetical protein
MRAALWRRDDMMQLHSASALDTVPRFMAAVRLQCCSRRRCSVRHRHCNAANDWRTVVRQNAVAASESGSQSAAACHAAGRVPAGSAARRPRTGGALFLSQCSHPIGAELAEASCTAQKKEADISCCCVSWSVTAASARGCVGAIKGLTSIARMLRARWLAVPAARARAPLSATSVCRSDTRRAACR